MLFVPLRLPVSVLLIKVFNWTAQIGGSELPRTVLVQNVVSSKIIYDIIIGVVFIYGAEMLTREIRGRKAIVEKDYEFINKGERLMYFTTILIMIFTFIFTMFDIHSTIELLKYF